MVASVALAAIGLAISAPSAGAAVPACGNTAIAISHSGVDAGMGHTVVVLLFRNVSGQPCSLVGYPGLDVRNGAGHVIAHARRTLSGYVAATTAVRSVTILPGDFASASVESDAFNPVNGAYCGASASIATTPPNTTHTVVFPVSIYLCQLEVHPVVAGTLGMAPAITGPACGNGSIAVYHSGVDGAAGHGSAILYFRNVSSSTCRLYGYPGLDVLDAHGRVLAHAQRTVSGYSGGVHVVAPVTIAPGNFASATAEWLFYNPVTLGDCAYSTWVAITPPNTTHTVVVPWSINICALQIHPVTGGTLGYN
jgi:hypothetical protein